MASRKVLRQVTVSFIVLVVCGGIGVGLSRLSNPPEKKKIPVTIPLIESQVLEPESVRFSINSQGVVRPAIETILVAQVSGQVKQVSPVFVSGGVFSEGEVLANIDDSDYRVALHQAEASLAASKARLAEEQARSDAETQSWLRSGRKLTDAPALLLRHPYVAEATAGVEAASAQVEKARRDLERTIIKAPYDGMVRERAINMGQYLSPGAVIGSVFATRYSEIRLPIKPTDLAFIALPPAGRDIAADIQVQLSQVQGQNRITWQAQLTRVEGVVDERSRMHYIVATVNDPYGFDSLSDKEPLKAGSFVTAHFPGTEMEGLFRIPRSAVYGDGRVLVVDGSNSLRYRSIKTVYADNESVYVAEGLHAGEVLSLTPLTNPVEGTRVQLAVPLADVAEPPVRLPGK